MFGAAISLSLFTSVCEPCRSRADDIDWLSDHRMGSTHRRRLGVQEQTKTRTSGVKGTPSAPPVAFFCYNIHTLITQQLR
jgi:hypothetical protein